MIDNVRFHSAFTPSRVPPEELEAINVQREDLLADAMERIWESATTGNKHHLLYIGPRGTGKTHLITLLQYKINQDVELNNKLHIAWLNEDETSTSLLELLRRIYVALCKRYPSQFTEAEIEPMYDMAPDEAEKWLGKRLLSGRNNRMLLVLTENLDALFDSLGDKGQKKLRAFIQESPVFSIVATAQRLTADIKDRKKVFFGFFQTEFLKVLTVDQAAELLKKIAMKNGQKEVVDFLNSAPGYARVRALHHLSGGNHRIFIVLSQFIAKETINALVTPFMKMVDDMTPYYQERIRWLPPQQRKIVEYLCASNRPVPVKQVARHLFASQQTISSQLKSLRNKGYVQSSQRGRESLYEIAEPLMRICVEVKENQSHQPLRLLVDFLRVWYDEQELPTRLESCAANTVERIYLESAIKMNDNQENLRSKLIVDGYCSEIEGKQVEFWRGLIRYAAKKMPELGTVFGEWANGNDRKALALFDDIVSDSSATLEIIATAYRLRGAAFGHQGMPEKAFADFNRVIELPDVPVEEVARVLINRGIAYGKQGELEKAFADFSRVIELPDIPVELVAKALDNRGITYGKQGELGKAFADFNRVIKLPDAPVEQVTQALLNRGITCGQQGELGKAIGDYSRIAELPDAPVEYVAKALLNRGNVYSQQGEDRKAVADYSHVIELPEAPVEQVTQALLNRGITYGKQGELGKAIGDYSHIVELLDAPVEEVARALLNRGNAYSQQEEDRKAVADYSHVIELPEAPVEQVTRALLNRGITYGQQGELGKAIGDYSRVVELLDAPVEQVALALVNRGSTFGRQGEVGKAIADYNRVVELLDAPARQVAMALNNRGFAFGRQGEDGKAIADYCRVMELPDVPVGCVAKALLNRGNAYSKYGEDRKAVADYSHVIELLDAPVEDVAWALINRGIVYGRQGEVGKATIDFSRVVELPEIPKGYLLHALFALAETNISAGCWEKAVSNLDEALRLGSQGDWEFDSATTDVIHALFESSLRPAILHQRIQEISAVYQANKAETQLGEALVSQLGKLYVSGEPLPASDGLALWASAWEDALKENENMTLSLRLFLTGIAFLESGGKDRSVLLDLNQEERRILEQAFKLD